MKRLFQCLKLFVGWLQGGLYDFSTLPISVFVHLNHKDVETIMRAHSKYSCKLKIEDSCRRYHLLSFIPSNERYCHQCTTSVENELHFIVMPFIPQPRRIF